MKLSPETELEFAKSVQEHTQPRHVPELPGYEVFAKTIPATWGNGDFFDFIGVRPREGGKGYVMETGGSVDDLVLSLGDATGHGMGAALMATSFVAMLRMSIRLGVYHRDLLAALNAQLHEDLPEGCFITLLLGRINRVKNVFRWVSFGQGPLWHYREADRSVETLQAHNPPLGILPEIFSYTPTETFLEPGDAILAISDGFHETCNTAEELVGEEVLRQEFARIATLAPDRVFQALLTRIESHAGGLAQADDRTFLLIRRKAEPPV